MTMQNLRAATMVSLSWPWAEPGHPERDALESIPELAVLLPYIERAHQTLLDAQGMSIAERVAPLVEHINGMDGRHDAYWRTIHFCLQTHIQLAQARGELERASQLAAVQARLMPYGLKVVSLTYREEVGEVKLLASRLNPDVRATLADIPVAGSNLLGVVEELITAGEELGRLEDQRAEAREIRHTSNMAEARALWMRTVTMLRTILAVVPVSDPTIADIMARIRDAEKQAARRLLSLEDSDDDGDGGGSDDGSDSSAS